MGSLVQIQAPRPSFAPMPVLLLTNDDGVHASGLQALAEALAELGEAHVLAPEREQNACGHALTLHRPLLGHRVYSEKIVEQSDPRGRTHYWIGAGEATWEDLEGTDMGALHEGYVSVTPLHLDLTAP